MVAAADRESAGSALARAEALGLRVVDEGAPPSGVTIVEAAWPGARHGERPHGEQSQSSGERASVGGPTGIPWLDSIGWVVQLNRARKPDSIIWVDAPPDGGIVRVESYLRTIADAASNGGSWIISLDGDLARGIVAQKPAAIETWKKILQAYEFFERHAAWGNSYRRVATFGVVSDFAGDNEFLAGEILNLETRNNQPCLILDKSKVDGAALKGLRAAVYVDEQPPEAALRRTLLSFAEAGGLLIAGAKWGAPEGKPLPDTHPRFSFRSLGKGRLAVSKEEAPDPYILTKDIPILISHRYDVLRLFGASAAILYYTVAPDGSRGVVQLVSFSYLPRDGQAISVRVAAPYREARIYTLDNPEPKTIEMLVGKDASEAHLPPVSMYAAVEFVR